MEAIHLRVQADLVWLTWIAFMLAIPFYHFLRKRDPLIRWHEHGNVSTQPFGWLDLGAVLVFFLGLKVLMANLQNLAATKQSAQDVEFTLSLLLTDGLTKVAMLSFFVFWLMRRGVNVIEVFGLGRLNVKGVAIWGGVVGLLAIPLVMAVGNVANNLLTPMLGELPQQPIVEAFIDGQDVVFRFVMLLLVVLITPVFEEVLYRGYLYGVTKRFSDRFFALVFSSAVFSLAHSGVITVLPIFTLALFLVLAYELSGCLWVPILIHMLFNLANVIMMLLFPEAVR